MKRILFLTLLAACTQAHTQELTSDLVFADGSGIPRYLKAQGDDSLVLQTAGVGGIVLNSAYSVLINAAGEGLMFLGTQGSSSINIESGGDTFINPASGGWVTLGGDRTQVFSSQGLQLSPSASESTCDASSTGTLYYVSGRSGESDFLRVCMKAADDSYSWKNVTF